MNLDILNAVSAEGEAKPTHILYKANLSHERMVKYLDDLTGKGLLQMRQDGENRTYSLTPKGVGFLLEMRRAEAFVQGFGLAI
ncbi:MAG: winged helix DNA-binding protein [Nitrososphaerota archaeon]|nr:winged helix DNA-binding protein [Nitrososphaerota archaeon]MDG7024849.1 winged helix DNA-binding protein [Nitrososphaerota archaeon]